MRPLKISLMTFESAVLQSEKPVLLVFGATWDHDSICLFDMLDWYGEKLDKKLVTGVVDYDYVPDIFTDYQVYDLPTMIIFEGGKPVERRTGYRGAGEIDSLLERFWGYLPYVPRFKRIK
jgi:thioredoxin 1